MTAILEAILTLFLIGCFFKGIKRTWQLGNAIVDMGFNWLWRKVKREDK